MQAPTSAPHVVASSVALPSHAADASLQVDFDDDDDEEDEPPPAAQPKQPAANAHLHKVVLLHVAKAITSVCTVQVLSPNCKL